MYAVIGGQTVTIDHGSVNGQAQVGQRGQLTFNVIDASAAYTFTEGSAALIYDDSGNLLMSRWVAKAQRRRMSQSGLLYHQLTCTDNCYLADKRLAATTYTSQTAAFIVNDLVKNYLAAEGVYGVRNLLTANQSSIETDTTGFSAWGTGATLSRDATTAWTGAASLKAVCDGTSNPQGFFCLAPSTSYTAGMPYTASVYLKGAGTVLIEIEQQSPTVILALTTVTLTSTWTRYSIPFVTPNPLVATNYGFRIGTNASQAVTYWADGLMIEPDVTTSATSRNLLSLNQSDIETDTSGFIADQSATLTRDATHVWHGSHALKVVTPGTVIYEGTLINLNIGAYQRSTTYTASFYLYAAPSVSLFISWYNTGGAGNVGTSTTLSGTGGWQRVTLTYTTPSTLTGTFLGFLVNTSSVQAATFWLDGLQIEQAASASAWQAGLPDPASPWEVGGLTTITGGGITIGSFTANYAQVSACLDAIAQKAQGYTWWIDEQRRLFFGASSPASPPVATIDDTIIERDSESVSHGNTQYRNTQYIVGGTAHTASQTETRQGDGKATAFTMGYPLASVPTITLNAGAQTVGIKGVDTGKQWYWAAGDPVIAQDAAGVKLVSTDTLSVTYVGQYPIVTISQDAGGITTRQMREGGATSGIVEAVATDTTLATVSDAFQAASGYLARYSQDTQELTFLTTTAGFLPGQSVNVNIPGLNLANVPMLIESVTMTDSGPLGGEIAQLYYSVKALQGPLAANGTRFWKALALQAQQVQIDAINVGSSGLVAILQSGTLTFTWTVTGNATVNTLQFPSATLYPAPTLYPGGTAGTPTAITYTKPQVGLNALRDVLSGAGTTLKATYFAWGTGTQGTPATATQLAAESGRKAITSITNGANPGEEIITGYLGPTDATGVAITEIAFFGGPSASATANSGVMLLYGLYSHTHTNTESIQVTADSTFA